MAQRLGAGPGFPWTLSIQVVGEEIRDIQTRLYKIYLKDKSGQTRSLVAAGIDNISIVDPPPDLSVVLRILQEKAKRPWSGRMLTLMSSLGLATLASYPSEAPG